MQFLPLPAVFVGGEIVDMLSNTGPVAKLVLLTLLAFSLISWAIILTKWSQLRRARRQSGRFVRAFRKAQRLQDMAAVADQFKPSPLVGVFEGGYEEYQRQFAVGGGFRSFLPIQRGMQIGASEDPVHRFIRNSVGHHRRIPRARHGWGGDSAGGSPRDFGSADYDRCGPGCGHPRAGGVQPDWRVHPRICCPLR